MYALIQRLLVQRIGSPIDTLPYVTHFCEQPIIGRADQRGASLKFRQLYHGFFCEVEYPSPGIMLVGLMLYEAKADKFGYLLHHQLM